MKYVIFLILICFLNDAYACLLSTDCSTRSSYKIEESKQFVWNQKIVNTSISNKFTSTLMTYSCAQTGAFEIFSYTVTIGKVVLEQRRFCLPQNNENRKAMCTEFELGTSEERMFERSALGHPNHIVNTETGKFLECFFIPIYEKVHTVFFSITDNGLLKTINEICFLLEIIE